jgi:hypothetical protein
MMRDIDTIYTRRGTPVITVFSRLAFILFFTFATVAVNKDLPLFPNSTLEPIWVAYILLMYILAERLYLFFGKKNIDLTFAYPLLFAIYVLNMTTELLGGQEQLPLLNRAEHFTSFILLTFIAWTFFTKYLPHEVWHEHPYYTAILVMSITSMLGVGNEIIELTLDQLFKTKLLGASIDTPLDLLMNTLGAGLFLAVRLIFREYEKG